MKAIQNISNINNNNSQIVRDFIISRINSELERIENHKKIIKEELIAATKGRTIIIKK